MTSVHEAAADMVDQPSHYTFGPYKLKDIEKALSDKMTANPMVTGAKILLTPYQARLYFAALEYIVRAPWKNGEQDFEKAAQEIRLLLEDMRREA